MNRPRKLIAVASLAALMTTGCTGSSTPGTPATSGGSPSVATPTAGRPADTTAKSGPAQPGTAKGVIRVPQDKLAIGDYMPPLDDDRVEIAKPQGWQALPRDSAYLTRFFQTNRNGLPRIEITVEPRTYGEIESVTADNVEQFAKLVAKDLGDLELIENVLPLQIGETACARYVGRVDLKLAAGQTINAERQRLLVLQGGRLYTIDLLVLPNTLRQSRDAAYAVCASLRFGGPPHPAGDGLLSE